MNREEEHYFKCMCGCSLLGVLVDEFDEGHDWLWLTFYGEHTMSFRDRLRNAWNIIRYGHAATGREFLLERKEAYDLAAVIRLAASQMRHPSQPTRSTPFERKW